MKSWKINDDILEFDEDGHIYLVNGVVVPSVSQLLNFKFKNKYEGVSERVLKRAADKGTELHEAIEMYCRFGLEKDLVELRNFKFLQKQYNFEVVENEVPIIIYYRKKPVAAGRLDLVLKEGKDLILADIKRTSVLDKEYLGYQLNLYKIGYEQSYHRSIKHLKGLHLRENIRRYINIPINKKIVVEYLKMALKRY